MNDFARPIGSATSERLTLYFGSDAAWQAPRLLYSDDPTSYRTVELDSRSAAGAAPPI